MNWASWTTCGVVTTVFGLLAFTRISPDLVLMAAVSGLLLLGVITPEEAFSGFANEGTVIIGVLFVIAAGLKRTGGLNMLVQRVLGRPGSLASAQMRLMVPAAAASAFLNNTAIVAVLLPVIEDWAKRCRVSVSKLLMPLSFAAMLGGTCTLIGTSTNLVIYGMTTDSRFAEHALPELSMFDLAWVGIPCSLLGILFVLVFSKWLLHERVPVFSSMVDPREYSVEMIVTEKSSLVGKTIEEAGLRHLPGLYLMEIEREAEVRPAVSPLERLQAEDRLVFVGVVDSVVDLQQIPGLRPATNQVFKLDAPRVGRCLLEAVVSDSCPTIGKSIREGRFRSMYNAAVIAVARNGERLKMKVGDIVLRVGDTLLLEAPESFYDQHRNTRDFYLVNRINDSTPPRFERAWIAVSILLAMVVSISIGLLTAIQAALLAAGLMIVTRCCRGNEARRSVDWQVLIVIGAAFGLGRAVESSGLATNIASGLISVAGQDPYVALATIYLLTLLFTNMITNTAAATLIFPIAIATAETLGVSVAPFIIAMMNAAASSFATPIGYQTNLMVFSPGGYRFTDYLKLGIPLSVITWIVTMVVVPIIWPF